MNELEEGTHILTSEIENDSHLSGNVPLDIGSQESQQCKSKCVSIPHHRFEIEGEAFMCAL